MQPFSLLKNFLVCSRFFSINTRDFSCISSDMELSSWQGGSSRLIDLIILFWLLLLLPAGDPHAPTAAGVLGNSTKNDTLSELVLLSSGAGLFAYIDCVILWLLGVFADWDLGIWKKWIKKPFHHDDMSLFQALFLCTPFLTKMEIVHLFSSSLPRFDKWHETSWIFPRTEQTFANARS